MRGWRRGARLEARCELDVLACRARTETKDQLRGRAGRCEEPVPVVLDGKITPGRREDGRARVTLAREVAAEPRRGPDVAARQAALRADPPDPVVADAVVSGLLVILLLLSPVS